MSEQAAPTSSSSQSARSKVVPTPDQIETMGRALLGSALANEGVERALVENGIPRAGVEEHVLDLLKTDRSLLATVAQVAAADIARERSDPELWITRPLSWPLRRIVKVAAGFLGVWIALGGLVSLVVGRSVALGALFAAGTGLIAIAALSTQIPRLRYNQAVADHEWERAEIEFARARDDAIENALLPEVRARIYQLTDPAFSPLLTPVDAGGLRKLFDPRYEVPVGATGALRDTLSGLEEAGSVGVAGPRGVGKTTLIRAACQGRLDFDGTPEDGEKELPRGVMVSAPVRYTAQDFVRFLFEKLCLAELSPSPEEKRFQKAHAAGRRRLLMLLGLFAVLLAWEAVVLLVIAEVQLGRNAWLAIGSGGVAVFVMFGVWRLMGAGRARRRLLLEDPARAEAEECLERLRYQETRSEEESGQIAAKAVTLARKRGVSRAAQAWTLPETIERYRYFLSLLAERGPVVIGIDELDKMSGADEARSFLNEMKSLFDQPGVYYLVSVSEDALSDFERRGQPIRDVFDSVFSDILHVGYLSREESDLLLRRRAIGVAPPWPALFHCLAGGLPRESIRVARRAVQIAEKQAPDLTNVTLGLVAERVAAHEHAAGVVAQSEVIRDGTQPILTWLRELPQIEPGDGSGNGQPRHDVARSALLKRIEGVGGVAAQVRNGGRADEPRKKVEGLERLVMELAAGWHHALTCLEFFAGLEEEKFDEACKVGGSSSSSLNAIELLARGHQDLSASPALSWQTVTAFRRRVGLDLLRYPSLDPAGDLPESAAVVSTTPET